MKQILATYAARFDALSVRERMLVFAAGITAIVFVIYSALLGPQIKQRAQLAERVDQQQRLLSATRETVAALIQSKTDPDAPLKAQREHLRRERAAIDAELKGATRTLVPADRMNELLEALVRRDPRVRIVNLRALAPEPLADKRETRPEAASAPRSVDEPGVFRQGVEVTVQGSYADLAGYVTRLEGMPVKMYWSRAALDAQAHPRIRLTLTLYTLSFDRSWLTL